MNLHDMIKGSVNYLSGVEIVVNSLQGWVLIRDKEGIQNDILLQDHEGYDFIARADDLYWKVGTVNLCDCYAFLARDYVDCI